MDSDPQSPETDLPENPTLPEMYERLVQLGAKRDEIQDAMNALQDAINKMTAKICKPRKN